MQNPWNTCWKAGCTVVLLGLCFTLLKAREIVACTKDSSMKAQQGVVEWKLSVLNDSPLRGESKEGVPRTIDSPLGKAVSFDGSHDGIFLDTNPLEKLTQFTVEVFFQPDGRAPREQRFLHMGEANGDRLLMETRVTDDDQWYLDAFIKSGDSSRALIDNNKLHPTGAWYHIAFVVDNGRMDTYVNGEHELSGKVAFSPFKGGRTSIGVRMNKVSWFKGAIYKIRIMPKCLMPAEFMKS
jgi:hypothetical protein